MKRFEVINLSRLYSFFWIFCGHIALAYLIITQQWYMLFISLIMHYLIAIVGISAFYHRIVAHQSIKVPKWVEIIGCFIGGLSMQGSALNWATVHRQHHSYVSTDKDPHSPKHLGVWYVQFFGYTFSKIDPKFAGRLLKTYHLKWHRYYYWMYIPILILSLVVLPLDLALAIFWAPIALVFHFEGFVNTWTHAWNKDVPSNVPLVNLFVAGEAYHHNHHNFPTKVRFHKWDILGILMEKIFRQKGAQSK